MNLHDCLHCPDCKGRLGGRLPTELSCTDCDRRIRVIDGIADFVDDDVPGVSDPHRYSGDPNWDETVWSAMLDRIRSAAGERWPQSLGSVVELGCGRGQMTSALLGSTPVRNLVVFDTDMEMVVACRERLATLGLRPDQPAAFATLCGDQNAIRDTIADTIVGITLLPAIGDVRGVLTTVHRVLKPGGRALFVVPNRRYRQALCQAFAEALTGHYIRDSAWPEGYQDILANMAQTRRMLIHQGDLGFLAALREKHLFDSEALEELGREVGFATTETLPLDPDPAGGETARRFCHAAGMEEEDVKLFAPLVANVGHPFFSLLGHQDSSASMLLWLTKASGPRVAVFKARMAAPPIPFLRPEAALGGAQPRWSLELLAQDTPDGIDLSVGGWCLANTDVLWVRITLGGVTLNASVWRPRPDVHEVLNRSGLYHPLNALCSGLETEMLFNGVHAVDNRCSLSFDIVLANGLIISGPAPDSLVMEQQMVIAH